MNKTVPANRKPKFKPHVGRMFTLRQNEYYDIYKTARNSYTDRPRRVRREEVFGEVVTVFDETNTRVCVNQVTGHVAWIQKFFLLHEVKSEATETEDLLESAISDILEISLKLRENMVDSKGSEKSAKRLEEVASRLRAYSNTTTKKG